MSEESIARDLFDRWELVWHQGRYDLVADCVAPIYVRHDETGAREVTPAQYAAELAAGHQARPNTRVVVYDHDFAGDRAWFRFAIQWSDPVTGEPRSRVGMQSYRIEDGNLAETWALLQPVGTSWSDVTAQEHWTSKRGA